MAKEWVASGRTSGNITGVRSQTERRRRGGEAESDMKQQRDSCTKWKNFIKFRSFRCLAARRLLHLCTRTRVYQMELFSFSNIQQ